KLRWTGTPIGASLAALHRRAASETDLPASESRRSRTSTNWRDRLSPACLLAFRWLSREWLLTQHGKGTCSDSPSASHRARLITCRTGCRVAVAQGLSLGAPAH